ncbi:MAG: hypothetical protein ACOZAM_25460 [Pseudomonadota bacterium]
MADNVIIPATGGGTATPVIATDDVGGIHYQAVKIDLGGDGVSSPLLRGQQAAANGIPIAPPSDDTVTVSVDVTRPADATAYAAGDAFANSTSAPSVNGFQLTGVARGTGKTALLTDVALIYSNAAPDVVGELWIFDSAVTAINDNAVFTLSDADARKLVAIVPFVINKGAGNNKVGHIGNLCHLCTCVGSDDLKFLIKVVQAFTPASGDVLTVRAKFARLD